MRTPTMRSTSPITRTLLAGACLLLPFSVGLAQTSTEDECKANECFSPAFDVGIVYHPPVGQYGITDLMYAVEINDLAKVESLLASGADVNARNDGGATALLMAAAYGSGDIVNRLLAAGADPDIASYRGESPLRSAIWQNHIDIAVALLEHGADPSAYRNADDSRFRTGALASAAVRGQTEVVKLLIGLGVGVKEDGLEALSLALWKHHEEIVALLLETDIDLNAPTFDTMKHSRMQTGELVLQTAAQEGLQLSTEMLLEKGADVNGRNIHGESALYFAVRTNHPEIVSVLLNAGAVVAAIDVAAAIGAGNEATTQQLMLNVDPSALQSEEIEKLIVMADDANNTELLDRLFSERESRTRTEPVATLLFAKADVENCELIRWNLADGGQQIVFSSPGQCEQGFFYSKPRSELYVVEGLEISVVSLDAPAQAAQMIKLPTRMIDEDLAALKERLSVHFNGHDTSWMSARVVQAGVLESGEFAVVTHANGPADGAYGYLYALTNNIWRLVRNEDCHRFDPCRFEEVKSRSLHERPSNMTVWSPEIRRNPYFVEKTVTGVLDYEYTTKKGVISLDIDGQLSLLHYTMGESGHCAEDCVYTRGLSLELPHQGTVNIAEYGGNNGIVDRYALVSKRPWPRSELIDLGTGKSVFGELQVAGWYF